jgi:hypothetical protein
LATLLAGGCGIPDESDVTVDGPGQSSGTWVDDNGVPPVQYTRESTEDVVDFVQYYLRAAAGDPETAAARVKAFLEPGEAGQFPGGTDVRVVSLLEDPGYTPDNPEIKLRARTLGTLKANGLLEPEPPATVDYTLRVERVKGKDGLFVVDADPPVMLLSDKALADYYQMRTIYFWNKDYTGLVPDVRYMPSSVIGVKQPTTVLSWLARGPAPWLEDAVQQLPQGTTAPENVPAIDNDTLRITLSAEAAKQGDAQALDRLRRQLQWSLRPLAPRTLVIKIGQQDEVRYTDAEYQQSNPSFRLVDEPERFAMFNDVIRRLAGTPQADGPVPVLKPAANKGIATAAISTSGTHSFVAVVTGSGKNQRLRVAAAPTGEESDLKTVDELSGALGRPVWAVTKGGDRAGAVGLVTRNGQLYSFAADGSAARPVEWPGQPGAVTSVSVARDGNRVALVSGGRLYRAVLTTDGNALSAIEQLSPPPLTRVAAVRSNGRYSVLDVSADGALFTDRLKDLGTAPVTDLAAYPANPYRASRATGSAWASYVAGGAAYDVLAEPYKIEADHLAGPTAGAPAGATPTAPFFLD